jgi:hypothetical protein
VRLDVEIPAGAEERAHRVAMAAFSARKPTLRRRSYWKPVVAVAVVAAVAGALASPPGRSVIHAIREAVGVKKAQRELFSLPAPGRLLVNSPQGAWVVEQTGSRRLLGRYTEASWSPFGRFVVGVKNRYELVAMEPNGKVHWAVPEPAVRLPSWGGTHTDTRIAYLSTPVWSVRSLAGDSTDAQNLTSCSSVASVQPAWQPGSLRTLALFGAEGDVRVYDVPSCRLVMHTQPEPAPAKLQWSADGSLLLALTGVGATVYDTHGRVVSETTGVDDATFLARTHRIAALRNGSVFVPGSAPLFRAPGLRQIVSSPDGRWLLLTWPAADQWVFVRVAAPHTIRAVSGIARQFGGGAFPAVSGWIGK